MDKEAFTRPGKSSDKKMWLERNICKGFLKNSFRKKLNEIERKICKRRFEEYRKSEVKDVLNAG